MPKLEVEKALALSKIDNAIYAGSTVGTETELRAAVSNSANWTLGNSQSLNLSTETFPINALESTNSVHLTFGNPSNATTDINEQDNYLLIKDQYALSYNNSLKISNWVSWQLNTSWLGTAARQDDFRPDPSLPAGWYQVDDNDYQGSGFDRGHLVPSADRTASSEDNSATFFMTNMIPQAPDNNRNTWGNLEAFSRDLVIGDSSTANDDKELYIVAGSYGVGGIGSNGSLDAIVTPGGNITIPERTWKAILVLDNPGDGVADVTVDTRVIAVDMPNEQELSTNWQDFLVSVDELEVATGLDLFSNLPDDIEAVIEARVDGTVDGTGWIINEIHADPDGSIAGDANGDGTRNSSQDEFVELVNKTGGDVDISGWTLADGVSVRHTFPTGTIVPNQEAIVVFGGGIPTGSFGDATIQTASTGSLGLNNSGDTVTLNDGSADVTTVTYGSEGGNNQSLTRDPDLTGNLTAHSTATGSGGALFSPGTQIDGTSFNDSANITSIHELQGSTDTSPLEGDAVTIEGIVVGDFQGSNGLSGFFVQEEDSDADAESTTSEGIFIFDGSSPTVDVSEGDKVQVSGTVVELNSSGTTLTQLSSPTDISIISSGNPLPTAAVVNDLVDANTNSLERYEGMRVNLTETLSVTEYFQLGRFGSLVLSSGGRLQQPTNVVLPGIAANDLQAANDLRRLILDDGSEDSFPDTIIFGRGGNPLSTTNLLRGGVIRLMD